MNALSKVSALGVVLWFAVASVSFGQTPGGEPFQPVEVDSLKVQASGTGGRTADRVIKISAGPDRVFVPDSLRFRENSRSGGGAVWYDFREDLYENISVPVTVAGVEYKLDMPRVIAIQLHAETGSGTKNYNRGAWLNGYVEGRTIETNR